VRDFRFPLSYILSTGLLEHDCIWASLSDVSNESGACIFENQEFLEYLNLKANVCLKKYIERSSHCFELFFVRKIVSETSYTSVWL
jgi:hypothetical protein